MCDGGRLNQDINFRRPSQAVRSKRGVSRICSLNLRWSE